MGHDLGSHLGISTQVEPLERNSNHNGIIPKLKSFLAVLLDDPRYAASAFFTDMQLKKNFRQFLIHRYRDSSEEALFRLAGWKGTQRNDFNVQSPLCNLSHIAGGEVALVPAVGFIGDGAAEEAFLQQRIEILPGRLLVLVAQISPDLQSHPHAALVHRLFERLLQHVVLFRHSVQIQTVSLPRKLLPASYFSLLKGYHKA